MTPAAELHRARVLLRIQQAQSLLSDAAQLACPLVGWGDGPWDWIGDHYDATKALWHRVNNAPLPERLDSEPRQVAAGLAGRPDHMCPAPVPQASDYPAHGGGTAPQG